MKSAIITLVRGRHEHLRRQSEAIARLASAPDDYIVLALGDPAIPAITPGAFVIEIAVAPQAELPLAAARNAGASAAIDRGAELLIFLDVDCLPAPGLVSHYLKAAAREPCALLSGPVSYLPAPVQEADLARLPELASPHPARPNPDAGQLVAAEDRRLFWSLSFALTATTWRRIGGFCADYVGYGGEDTDFAEAAHAAGVSLYWVGGANAFHQYHQVSSPPVEHLTAILANAQLFHRRWGWWPMTGWLDAFAALGVARFDTDRGWLAAASNRPGSGP